MLLSVEFRHGRAFENSILDVLLEMERCFGGQDGLFRRGRPAAAQKRRDTRWKQEPLVSQTSAILAEGHRDRMSTVSNLETPSAYLG